METPQGLPPGRGVMGAAMCPFTGRHLQVAPPVDMRNVRPGLLSPAPHAVECGRGTINMSWVAQMDLDERRGSNRREPEGRKEGSVESLWGCSVYLQLGLKHVRTQNV